MFILLFLLWLILNGRVTLELCLLGALISAVVCGFLCAFADWRPAKSLWLLRKSGVLLAYAGVLLWEILKANLKMFRIVLDKRVKVTQTLITFEVDLKEEFTRTLLADSITLTPGTITVLQEGCRFVVHCLSREMIDGITEGSFMRLLKKLEA